MAPSWNDIRAFQLSRSADRLPRLKGPLFTSARESLVAARKSQMTGTRKNKAKTPSTMAISALPANVPEVGELLALWYAALSAWRRLGRVVVVVMTSPSVRLEESSAGDEETRCECRDDQQHDRDGR